MIWVTLHNKDNKGSAIRENMSENHRLKSMSHSLLDCIWIKNLIKKKNKKIEKLEDFIFFFSLLILNPTTILMLPLLSQTAIATLHGPNQIQTVKLTQALVQAF